MIAKTIDASFGTVTLDEIYSIFKEKQFNTSSGDINIALDYQNREHRINTYLDNLFSLASLPASLLSILQKLSILPSLETPNQTFVKMLTYGIDNVQPSEIINHANELAKRGWLIKAHNGVKCHRIVQQYILLNAKPAFDDLIGIITYFSNKLHCESTESWLEKVQWSDTQFQFLRMYLQNMKKLLVYQTT